MYTITTGGTTSEKAIELVLRKIKKAGFNTARICRNTKGFYIHVMQTASPTIAQKAKKTITALGYSAEVEE